MGIPAGGSIEQLAREHSRTAVADQQIDFGKSKVRVEREFDLFTPGVNEIAADHGLGRLQLAVDPPIALLQPRWIPRKIKMDEVATPGLQVDAFARGIGADQDAQRLFRRRATASSKFRTLGAMLAVAASATSSSCS
jgi:hypothetical protein